MKRPCRHCGRRKYLKARQLCWPCYYQPAVRDRYPVSTHCRGAREIEDFNGPGAAPAPTDARPGTPSKFAVLCERASRGERLWAAADAGPDLR